MASGGGGASQWVDVLIRKAGMQERFLEAFGERNADNKGPWRDQASIVPISHSPTELI
jgi:hypothetical protein